MSEREKDNLLSSLSEEEFIALFRQGDSRVIHGIYQLYYVRLCDFCYYILGNCSNSSDAQDIVSDVFERLLTVDRNNREIGQSLRGRDDIANYLYVAVRNQCSKVVRGSKRSKKREEVYEKTTRKEYILEDELDLEYDRGLADKTLLETVYRLNQRSIQVLLKIYFEDMSYEEIATEMNITRSTVGSLRQQGINLLAKILNKEDYVYHLYFLAIIAVSSI